MFNILKSLNRVEYIFSLTLITLILIVVFFAVGIYAFKKLPYYLSVYYALFYLAAIGMTWNYATWLPGASTPRFLAIIFPFFITLALLSERRWVYSLYIFMASILYAPLALAFFLGMWVF